MRRRVEEVQREDGKVRSERRDERAVEGRGERSRMDGERYPIFRRRDERLERIRKEWAEKRSGTVVWKWSYFGKTTGRRKGGFRIER